MNATLSTRQLRLVVLLVLVVVMAGGFLVVTHHKSTTPTTAGSTPVVTKPTQTTPAPSKSHTQTVIPTKLDTHGLPLVVARTLRKHPVVVVALSSPGSDLDSMTAAEARAGAADMKAGFVNLDVFRQQGGTAILRKIGVVNTPAVLVIKRSGGIYAEFKGFVDRDVVEQAVADAR